MTARSIITLLIRLLVGFNLVLAICSVWILQRLTPPLNQIYTRNVRSLDDCDAMLAALAHPVPDRMSFDRHFHQAAQNVTEQGERQAIAQLESAKQALDSATAENLPQARLAVVTAVLKLAEINRNAIAQEATHATQLRQAGAWTIVLLTLSFFATVLLLVRRLRQHLLTPLDDITQTLEANQRGDRFRRCRTQSNDQDMKLISSRINALLDQTTRNSTP